MSRIAVVGLKGRQEEALAYLQDVGTLQIEEILGDLRERLGCRQSAPLPMSERINEARSRLSSALAELPAAEPAAESLEIYRRLTHLPLERLFREIDRLSAAFESELRPLLKQRQAVRSEIRRIDRLLGYLPVTKPLLPHFISLDRYDTALLVADLRFRPLLDELESRLAQVTNGRVCALRSEGLRETGLLLAFPKDREAAVRSLLSESSLNEVRLPDYLKGVSADVAERRLRQRMSVLRDQWQALETLLARLAVRRRPEIEAAVLALDDLDEELGVASLVGQTERSFVACGWAPSAGLDEIRDQLEKKFDGQVALVNLPASADEERSAPVVFDNPRAIRPFESLLELMGPPRYGTIDPTPLLALFFVAFFGLIVGDIAYGLLIVAGALFLRRRARGSLTRALAGILAYGGASSVLFGLLYGEFLGDLLYRLNITRFVEIAGIRLPIEREHLVLPLFFLSLGLGLVHLLLGLLLGTVSAGRHGKTKLAIERLGEIGLLVGLVLFAGMAWGRIPHLVHHAAYVLVILGAVLLIYASGPLLGPLHALELFRSVLSYLRLAALALAGMSLAAMANHLGGAVGNLAFGAILGLLLHALNLGFSLVSPAIHSLRLNLLEFFGGFYEAGGRPYRPFHRMRG